MTGLQIPRVWLAFAAAALMVPAAQGDPAAQTVDIAAFEQLKALAGRWEGTMEAPATGPALIEFEVTSNGRAVLERQFGGTSHEMITVYSLAYDRLQANHFCAMGNQPAYRLADGSSPRDIRMEFVGGTGHEAPTSAGMRLQRVHRQPSVQPSTRP